MADDTKKPYQRLPGTGYRRLVPTWAMFALFFVIGIFVLLLRGRRVQLWLGGDHLLSVEWDGYREYYKRFRYSDIQAFIIRRTSEGLVWSVVAGWCAAIFGLCAYASSSLGALTFFWTLTGIFVLMLIYNLLSGPTCVSHLRTAVQTEQMPSLHRLRHAQKALELLRPSIVAAQGALATEEIPARMQQLYGANPDATQAVFPPTEIDPHTSPFA
jgi:hypothetical protein